MQNQQPNKLPVAGKKEWKKYSVQYQNAVLNINLPFYLSSHCISFFSIWVSNPSFFISTKYTTISIQNPIGHFHLVLSSHKNYSDKSCLKSPANTLVSSIPKSSKSIRLLLLVGLWLWKSRYMVRVLTRKDEFHWLRDVKSVFTNDTELIWHSTYDLKGVNRLYHFFVHHINSF